MAKMLKVETCNECGKFVKVKETRYCKIVREFFEDNYSIPSWCPLPEWEEPKGNKDGDK